MSKMKTFVQSTAYILKYVVLGFLAVCISTLLIDLGKRNMIQELCESNVYDFCQVTHVTYQLNKEVLDVVTK